MANKDDDMQLIDFKTGKAVKPRKHKEYNYQNRLSKEDYILSLGININDAAIASLSDAEIQFVCNMVSNGCNKSAAYAAAFNIDKKLDSTEQYRLDALLRKEEIKKLLRTGIQHKMSQVLDNLDSKLLDTYITRAFYDPADFIKDDGEPYRLSEIRPELRCVVDGVEKKYFGKDAEAFTITLKLANRDSALKTLSEYMGVVRPKMDVSVTNTVAENADDELQRLAEMSDDELKAELGRLQA